MKVKRFSSIVLCLVLVMSIFPFSVAAKSGDFVGDNEPNNPSCTNMIQTMTLDDNGEDPPIYGVSDFKTSYEFGEVTETFEVVYPKEGEDDEDNYEYCNVRFTPIIEEGDTPFYIAPGLHGESVFTIRDSDVDLRAAISNIMIEKEDLLEADEPRITFSEEYYNDSRGEIFYYIIFEVDFYSLKDSDEYIGTLECKIQVYDSPSIGVDVNYDGRISSYDYGESYVEGDIWNSTVNVTIIRDSAENVTEPVANVPTNFYYYWGQSSSNFNKPFCIFKPIADWVTTDSDGIAEFTIGDGVFPVGFSIGVSSPALYGKLVKGLGQDSLSQYYTYPDLKDFEGIIEVKVVNTARETLEGRQVNFWGGAKFDGSGGGTTGEDGIAEIRYPSSTTSTDRTELTITELPTFDLKWNLTQVIDNPEHIVDGHNAPLYLSPEVKVSDGYFMNPYTEVKGVRLQVYDVNNPEKTLIETSPMAFKEKYDEYRDIIVRSSHRAYIKVSPQDLAGKRLGIRAVVRNKDEGAREEYQVGGHIEDPESSHQLYVPKKEFTFAFVPLRVGAWENNSSISYGSLSGQKEFIRKIFPAPIKFIEKSPMFIAKPRFSTHDMYLSRIFRELDRTQKLFSDKYDLYIGMTPPGFLGAAGLQDSGLLGMNWSFFGAVHGAVLIEPSKTLPHTTIHEFIHTLGFSDVYPSDYDSLLSANGHDGSPINNVEGREPAYQTIMYDAASNPWPTAAEYNALLEYATKPASGKMGLLSMGTLSEQKSVILVSGSIEDARTNQRKIYFDPIIEYTDYADVSSDYYSNGYVIQTLASDDSVLSQYFFSDYEFEGKYYATFIANLPAENVETIEIGKQSDGFITEVFQRYEYSANAPVVSLTGPDDTPLYGDFTVTWDASDDDGDELLSELQVSFDGGNSWDSIAIGIPYNAIGKYSHKVNAENFPEGDNYKFKVIVTDGMHSTEAVSNEYTILGYQQKPILNLPESVTVQLNPGTEEASTYIELGNSGKEELNIEFSLDATSTFVSPLFTKEYIIYPGQNQMIAIPLILPGDSENIIEETISLISNDPNKPTIDLTIKIEYVEDTLKPELASLSATPSDFMEQGSDLQVTFDAYAAAGQSDLEATIIIEDQNENVILNDMMDENYHKSGAYTYYWEAEDLSIGNYGVYIGLKDTDLEREKTGYDFTFNITSPNASPVFVEPENYENDLGVVKRGESITIPYEVNDPDGDTLDINVYSNLSEHGLKVIKETANSGNIEWTANVSGTHSIYLIATDALGNSAEVMFNIAEIEDLNIFTITLEANPAEAGEVYGNGLYNPGEFVTVEAVPEELYKFINWTEENEIVSYEPVYTFNATEDRNLVANFEEVAIFDYCIEDKKVIIKGFADEELQDLIIPDEIEGYPVTGINNTAFYLKQIKSISFPETLTNIGSKAFQSTQLTEVVIPNCVNTIGDYAFSFNYDLVEVVIPNENVVIGEGAFSQCSPDLIIYGVPGSSVDTYATDNNITFKSIDEYEGDIPATKYSITVANVIGGTATVTTNLASAEEGDTVIVNIGDIQSGRQFKTIKVLDEDNNDVAITKEIAGQKYNFTMPAKSVTVNVELQDAVVPETYILTLNCVGSDATGTGGYAENDIVTINAGKRSGYTFNGWISTDVTFANAKAQITTFTMPAKDVTVTATWKIISGGGSHQPTQYSVINNGSAQNANGKIKLSSNQAKVGDTVFITIEPDPGYENYIPTVLDQYGNPLTVSKNSDGTYSFQMPKGEVVIDAEYTKIEYFDDVDHSDWYNEAAWFCASHGLIEGTGNRQFDGNAATTRAMFVAILYRLSQSHITSEDIFADVDEGKWYTEAITWAAKNNIVSGYGNGDFGPEDILTREQMVTILHKYSKFMGYDISEKADLDAFNDAGNISDWAIIQMQWAIGNGLIKGVGNNLVSPQTGANRAQLAAILQRYYFEFN